MSTDFCMEAILQRSCSNISMNSQRSPQSSPKQQSPLAEKPTQQPNKRGQKRKRGDDENSEARPTKRGRTMFTKTQLSYLESVFSHNPYPDKLLKESIAEKLSLTQQKVHVWFQNRRSKQRKVTGHSVPQVTSLPRPLTVTYPQVSTFVPDPSMPVYFPLRTPSPSTPQTTPPTSPPLYLPTTSTMPTPHTPLTRIPYPLPRTTELSTSNVTAPYMFNQSQLPSVFTQSSASYW